MRPRHLITEANELTLALDAAEHRCPGLSRPQLLVQLALEGDRAAQDGNAERRRLSALSRHDGVLTGVYGPNYLTQLRQDWPN